VGNGKDLLAAKGPLLEMRSISKRFDGICALDNVDLVVLRGEVHALVGENGAGKSTLIKILSGFYGKDSGSIVLDGSELHFHSPLDSKAAGISVIYQDFDLAPNLTVADNLLLGRETTRFGFLRYGQQARLAERYLEAVGLHVDVRRLVGELSVAQRQLVAIASALSYSAKILVMDEPTSALSVEDIRHLQRLIRQVKEHGTSVIYISHKMEEVFEISDEITVLRDGQCIGNKVTMETTRDDIVSMMVGRRLSGYFNKEEHVQDAPLLEVKELERAGAFSRISFCLHKGEILGIYGLKGSGRSEIVGSIFGLRPADKGKILVNGKERNISSPSVAMQAGIGMIPEDRSLMGIFPNMNVRENISLAMLERCSRLGFMRREAERKQVLTYVERLRIKLSYPDQMIATLSGGNQQKAILARWLAIEPEILVLDEPTVGIDVGAKAEIYHLMDELAAAGMGLLMISSELPEVLSMSDRILVVHDGRIVTEFSRRDASEEKIIHSIHAFAKETERRQ
jgi:ribose transport system ATP-binding protein